MQLFLDPTCKTMLRNSVYSADNFCYFGGEVTELSLNPDSQNNQHFTLAARPWTRTEAVESFQVSLKRKRIKGALHEDQ